MKLLILCALVALVAGCNRLTATAKLMPWHIDTAMKHCAHHGGLHALQYGVTSKWRAAVFAQVEVQFTCNDGALITVEDRVYKEDPSINCGQCEATYYQYQIKGAV
jgi:hypothetical protein